VACFIEEYPDFGGDLLSHFNEDIDEARRAAEESYTGCYSSLDDYARELTEQTSDVPKHLEFYIDYDRMARDMEMSGDIFAIHSAHDEVHVFWAH